MHGVILVMSAVMFAGAVFAGWAMNRQRRRESRKRGPTDQDAPPRYNAVTGGDWYDRRKWWSQGPGRH
jgi:hypothetical protein